MTTVDDIGFDVHEKSISFCIKAADGRVLEEGKIPARRKDLTAWAQARRTPWVGAMEATLFTGWIYDHLRPHAQQLKVGHPMMMKAIAASKKKNDRVDARKVPTCCAVTCCRSATWRRVGCGNCGGCCAIAI